MSNPKTEKELKEELQALLKAKKPDFRKILKCSHDLSKFDPDFQHFSIDAKTLIHLGRDSIKDHTTALIELVKNSYDADGKNVIIEIFCKDGMNMIRLADNGFGMSISELKENWLRIGYSGKRKSKLSQLGRRKTGEKGIGRISTDRLGADLQLRSVAEGHALTGLEVNWDQFDVEGKEVFEIDIPTIKPTKIEIPDKGGIKSKTGTEIIITNLRQAWTPKNIENLYYELSALTPPFEDVKDFEITLNTDVTQVFSGKVSSDFYKTAQIELTAVYDGKGSQILYTIKDKFNKKDTTEYIDWQNIMTRVKDSEDLSEDLSLGPVTIKLLFFLRQAASIRGTDFKLDDLRNFLDNNAGIKIYRDNFAVKPYGFPSSQFGFDWLELGDRKNRNPAGVGRSSEYTVNPNQLVGAVFIERDKNPKLIDSAAREGLVESEQFAEVKALVMGSITILETHRAELYEKFEKKDIAKDESKSASTQEADKIKSKLFDVRENLNTIKDEIERKGDTIKPAAFLQPIARSINLVEDLQEDVDLTISELINWQRVLGGLATMGIASAVFGHETESSISQFKGSLKAAKLLLSKAPVKIEEALKHLEIAQTHSTKVAAWGAYALTRVQKEKRSRRATPVITTIKNVVKELQPVFKAAFVEVNITGDTFITKNYPIDIESVLVNLLTNAYTATELKQRPRQLAIHIEKEVRDKVKGYYFSVSDSGPGIPKQFEHRLFEPLFSTKSVGTNNSKSVGTGLGLTIVKSVTEELKGQVTFTKDEKLQGAKFIIWLPIIE